MEQLEEKYRAAISLLNIREEQIGEFLSEGAAEHSVHPTAFGVGMLSFLAGVVIGWFMSSRKHGDGGRWKGRKYERRNLDKST